MAALRSPRPGADPERLGVLRGGRPLGVALLSASSRALALVLGLTAAAATAAPPLLVTRVSVRSEIEIEPEEVLPLLAFRPGEPLDDERRRRTLRSLRLAGVAAEVELWTRPHADGVEAIVVLRPDVRVSAVELEGDTGLPARDLRAAVPQRTGEPLREDRVVRGVYAIQEALAAQGWLHAVVRVDVEVVPETLRARVVYRIEAGRRAEIGVVRFDGLPASVTTQSVLEAVRARPGEPFRRAVVRDDADRLRRLLVHRGYRLAAVEAVAENERQAVAAMDLDWRVEAGPLVELQVVGAERRWLEKRDLLPFLGDAGYDEALLVQAVDQIKAAFQERGHYDVEVRTAEERTPERLRIRLEILPGPRSTLAAIEFEGNEAFTDERLARLMITSRRRLLAPGSGRLVDAELTEDLANLRSFYALEGYERAVIRRPRVAREGDRLRLVVDIEEGVRRSVAEVRVEGLSESEAAEIAGELPLEEGGPYHRLLLEASAELIHSRLEERGFRAALVAPETEWNAEGTVARVVFRVLPGERSTADAVIVRGNTRTDGTVLRRFVPLDPGEPISTSALLDVQRALYRLGVFSRVDVGVPAGASGPAQHEVLIQVEEGRTRSVSYGAGWDSESGARGVVRATESNLFGRLVMLQLDALVSQKEEVYRGLVRRPYLWQWPIEASLLGYREAEDHEEFDVRRRGLQLGLERVFGTRKVRLFYDYRIVELETDQPDEVIPLESREARVASLTPWALWDRRDDPIDPRDGWSASLQVERAIPLLDADAEFAKFFSQLTYYLSLGEAGVLAVSLRGGALQPYAEPEDPTLEPIDAVPASELFYAGGLTTHRAYRRDELGIPGETLFVDPVDGDVVPLGGGGLALANLEWRFPLVGALGGNVFLDGGNVWREAADVDPDEMRWGAGVGLRYLSPIGPLRVEIGWVLDRLPHEDRYVVSISLGNPF